MSANEVEQRLYRFQQRLGEAGLDAGVVYAAGKRNMYSNVLYLSGYYTFDPCEESFLVVPREGAPFLIVNVDWDVDRAARTAQVAEVLSRADIASGLGDILRKIGAGAGRIGLVGEEYLPLSLYKRMCKQVPAVEWVACTSFLREMRRVKSATEIAALREAARITERGIDAGMNALKEGISELDVMTICLSTMLNSGAYEIGFTPQVSFGVNTEVCMAPASDNRLAKGDMVVFDMGCIVKGYVGDASRTRIFGPAQKKAKEIYDIVFEAQARQLTAARPGMTAEELDAIGRNIIEKAGYGAHFNHYTGRGIGLDLHEEPFIDRGVTMVLEPGMVFSVEPGIYLPGTGGVRIEDTVLITDNGCEVLTSSERYRIG